jgi:hypothetical protein
VGFVRVLNDFAEWREMCRPSIGVATVAVTERYARRKLRIRKSEPLEYRGLTLKCIGSKQWRSRRMFA